MIKHIFIVLLLALSVGSCKHLPNEVDWVNPNSPVITTLSCNEDTIYFQEQILPIFNSGCATTDCHNVESHEDDLILDSYFNIMDSGEIEPGNPYEGDIYESITEDWTDDDLMPPLDEGGPLTTEQIDLIRLWIEQGALNTSCPNLMCDTLEVTYTADIWPLVETHCVGCHGGSSPDADLALENYDDIFDMIDGNEDAYISLIDGSADPVMPENTTGLPDCQVRMFEIWIENGMPND